MRFLVTSLLLALCLSLTSIELKAAGWRRDSTVEARATTVELSAEQPPLSREQPVGILNSRLRFGLDQAATQYRHEIGVTHGQSLKDDTSYQIATARSSVNFVEEHQTDSLSLGALFTHGTDPISQPLEVVVAAAPKDFLSVQAGYSHQRDFSARQGWRAELGLSQNQQGEFSVTTEDVQLAYVYRPARTWTTNWRVRLSEQQTPGFEDSHLREVANDHNISLSPGLSLEAGLGYSIREQGDQYGDGLIYMAALNYSTQSIIQDEGDGKGGASGEKKPAPEKADFKSEDGLRGISIARVGWSRSRDQRRIGDPIFVADQFFATWGIGLSPVHALQVDIRRTIAQEGPQSVDGLQEDTGTIAYRYNHDYGTGSKTVHGTLGLEASTQKTETAVQTLHRTLYSILYAIAF